MKLHSLFSVLVSSAALAGCGDEIPLHACDPGGVDGIAIAPKDAHGGVPYALGYPPYAIDGCRLAYVSESGDLLLRDLDRGTEQKLAPAADLPRRPALSGDDVVWEATLGGRQVVRLAGASGDALTLEGPFDHAGEPRVAGGAVVMTAWLGPDDTSDSDVYLYDITHGALSAIAAGPGQQRFADISSSHVAWTDFAEDPDGTFDNDETDVADVVLMDRASGSPHTFSQEGKQAFPALGADGKLVVLDWGLVHPEPKFNGYGILAADLTGGDYVVVADVSTQAPYLRPVARGPWIEWVGTSDDTPALFRLPASLDDGPSVVSDFPDLKVFGPSASDAILMVGAADGDAVTLRAFDRPRP